ncbi:MAG TPA: hypothetical protein VMD59_03730 [Acidimicrobiales bacterium]|nr:hypothetical protein [Acidimicrobiales bacterium]
MDDVPGAVPGDRPTRPELDGTPPDVDLGQVWIAVAATVWQRRAGWLERLAGKLLRSPGLARALLTTPALLLPWLIASVLVLGVGAAATSPTGEPLVGFLAPALAAAGIAYAYGPGIDPAWELSRSMAVGDRMVLLVRALCVFAVDAALGLLASAGSGTATGITFEWLVPMTALSLLALAVATLARSANVGVGVGLSAWCITVLAGKAADGQFSFAVSDHTLLPIYFGIAALSGASVLYATRAPSTTSSTRS